MLIKVPGAGEGVEAFEELTALGVNVNVTLLFAVERYEAIAEAFIKGLDRAHMRKRQVEFREVNVDRELLRTARGHEGRQGARGDGGGKGWRGAAGVVAPTHVAAEFLQRVSGVAAVVGSELKGDVVMQNSSP